MPRLRHTQRQRPAQAFAGTPARVRNGDRPKRVAKTLIKAAERGPEMFTAVEPELAGLGGGQLKGVIIELWNELARRASAQERS